MLKHKGLPGKVKILKLDTPANVVLLEFTAPAGRMPEFNAKLPADVAASAWDQLAMFHFADGIDADQAQAQLILMPARLEGGRIRLDGQVDWSAWGSPLISREGVVGIVQQEKTGVTLGSALKALNH